MKDSSLLAISPVDGRYYSKTSVLSDYFSEFALIKYRVRVEISYLKALKEADVQGVNKMKKEEVDFLEHIAREFTTDDAEEIKKIEKTTNHDVKAVEYFLKEKLEKKGLAKYKEFVHFGLTSQDINNTATPLMLKEAMQNVYYPNLERIVEALNYKAREWSAIPMLARTHGQPASPTRLGKEIEVFVQRILVQKKQLEAIPYSAKFGGATGNMNAHYAAFPTVDWHGFANNFLQNYLGLTRSYPTTQIEHYDNLAATFHCLSRINTILVDLCRDFWTYISMEYFGQKVIENEIGSSAMPHKVNPIDFENAEGNLGLANAIFGHLAEKLPVSRLQRDLTDSTVLRNIGVPFAHTIIALQSITKGLSKITLNEEKLRKDLDANWMVVAEGIQNILRREGYPQPYEALKAFTRGKGAIRKEEIAGFIDSLSVADSVKTELKALTPENYVGK